MSSSLAYPETIYESTPCTPWDGLSVHLYCTDRVKRMWTTLLGRICTRCWSMAVEVSDHSAARTLVRSGADVGMSSKLQVHPKGVQWGWGQGSGQDNPHISSTLTLTVCLHGAARIMLEHIVSFRPTYSICQVFSYFWTSQYISLIELYIYNI